MNPLLEEDAGEARQKSYASAVRLLARREHSVLELRRKLGDRGFPGAVIETVLDDLVDDGLLSDERFAEAYVRARFERGYGPVRIQIELRERGVSEVLIEAPLGEFSGQWFESARYQHNKRFGSRIPDEYRERAKQMRFLQQRGFTSEQIRAVFDDFPT